MDDQTKKKILWIRELLKKNAPSVYKYFYSYKLNQKNEQSAKPVVPEPSR